MSAEVSVLMPSPPSKSLFGRDALDDDDAAAECRRNARRAARSRRACCPCGSSGRRRGRVQCKIIGMHLGARLAFAFAARRHLVERRVEVVARRRRGEAERVRRVGVLGHVPVVGQARHRPRRGRSRTCARSGSSRHGGAKRNLPSAIAEPVRVVRRLEVRLHVEPFLLREVLDRPPAGVLQRPVDRVRARVMSKPGCLAPTRFASAQMTS